MLVALCFLHTLSLLVAESLYFLSLYKKRISKFSKNSVLRLDPHVHWTHYSSELPHHMDVWDQKDVGSSLMACVCDKIRIFMADWGSLAMMACKKEEVAVTHVDVKQEEWSEEMLMRALPP